MTSLSCSTSQSRRRRPSGRDQPCVAGLRPPSATRGSTPLEFPTSTRKDGSDDGSESSSGDRISRGVDRRGSARRRCRELDRQGRHGVGLGSEMRSRQRQEGNGLADQDRRPRHAHPGRRLHDGRQDRGRVLRLRQRQRRHQRPAGQVHALQRTAQPGTGGRAREEDGPERQGRRHRGQHELRRVRDELEVLQEQGLHRDRRRRPGGVLQHAVVRRDEHGPALQQRRGGPGADRGRSQEDRDRLA